jgi:hypothetical protein
VSDACAVPLEQAILRAKGFFGPDVKFDEFARGLRERRAFTVSRLITSRATSSDTSHDQPSEVSKATDRMGILPSKKVIDHVAKCGVRLVGFPVCPTEFAKVIQHDVNCYIVIRRFRWCDVRRSHTSLLNTGRSLT